MPEGEPNKPKGKSAADQIKTYIDEHGVDPDVPVREIAAARLWKTGDPENQAAAEEIWKKVGTPKSGVSELKKDYDPNKEPEEDARY